MKIKDFLFLPLRIFLSNEHVSSLGLTSILEERINICAEHAVSPVLDIGCGEGNLFIRTKQNQGYGLDIFPFNDIDVCADVMHIPFKKGYFQTVSFIGSFNYMKKPEKVLQEVKGVLNKKGILLITITNDFWSRFRHVLAWWDKEQNVIGKELKYSYSDNDIKSLLEINGFKITKKVRYLMGVSKLFIVKVNPSR